MKKIILSVILCGSLALTLAGCGNNNGGSDMSSGESTEESSTSESSSESSSSSLESSSDINDLDNSNPIVDNSGLDYPDNRAGRMAAAALNTDEWPYMQVVSDPELIGTMFSTDSGETFNLDDLEEFCFCTNLISAQLNEVIVVKPVNGREGAVQDVLDSYLNYTQNGAAFYPDQEISAAGAVSGKTADNYMYLIVHENGAAIADAIRDVL